MQARLSLTAMALLAILAGGCASTQERRADLISALSAPQRGISEEQINSLWSAEGRHQFTALLDPEQGGRPARWLLLEYPVGEARVPYYALFREGRLAAVIDPSALEGPRRLTGERRVRAVLDAPDLSGEAIEASVSRRLAAGDRGQRARNDEEAPLTRIVPRQIPIGMSINEVRARLGPPAAVSGPAMNTFIHAWGPRNAAEGSVSPVPHLSVTFVNGQVVRVFSGDFFDHGLLADSRGAQ